MKDLIADLKDEQDQLDDLVADLEESAWDRVTPAGPWTIRDTISHLAFFDERQVQAISDPDGFADEINVRLAGANEDYMAIAIGQGRSLDPGGVLEWWRTARARELVAFAPLEADTLLSWYGPAMKAQSAVVARMMETWAHGQDVADTLGATRAPTARLFHIAELGVKTFSWSFLNRGLMVPETRVRVTLEGPGGAARTWNETSTDRIAGPVEDFCLVVAQRRNVADTALQVEGDVARNWMEVAQIFAGPPGPGRPPTTA